LYLSEISNQGFRNLSPDAVSLGEGVTLITGENAQGKTNLLEAAALVCGQRSFRGASPAAMAKDGERFSVTASFDGRAGAERVTIAWSKETGREFSRAGKPAGFREISEKAPAVFLAPEHAELLTGSPSGRRRFLDRLVLGVRPAAGDDQSRYARALSERNALLARARRHSAAAPGELEAWTEELVLAGAAVRRHRKAALSEWERDFAVLAGQAGPAYASIRAVCSAEDDSAESLRGELSRVAGLELRRGHTLAGPHRDDLLWLRNGRGLATQASAGEVARAVALIKLAEWHAVARRAGEPPLFAADDFDAHLAEGWVEDFFDALPAQASVLLTTAAPPSRWAARAAAVLEVRGGFVSRPRALRAVKA
jgi:DNA replication and repair protein RecF